MTTLTMLTVVFMGTSMLAALVMMALMCWAIVEAETKPAVPPIVFVAATMLASALFWLLLATAVTASRVAEVLEAAGWQ